MSNTEVTEFIEGEALPTVLNTIDTFEAIVTGSQARGEEPDPDAVEALLQFITIRDQLQGFVEANA